LAAVVESRAEHTEAECCFDSVQPLDHSWDHLEGATKDVMVVSRSWLVVEAVEACCHKNDDRKHAAYQELILEALPAYVRVLLLEV
jgi:hypothetical protein